jgi:hypothetical protein
MKVEIKDLIRYKVSFGEYIILSCVYKNDKDSLLSYIKHFGKFDKTLFMSLIDKGYIQDVDKDPEEPYIFDKLKITSKFEDDFISRKSIKSNVDLWITEWYDLWPKGITSGGHPLRSDKPACSKKMSKFIDNHPDYSKELIFDATRAYLERCKRENYQYTRLAPYFIEKHDISLLSRECELLLEGNKNVISNTENKTTLGVDEF